VSLRWCGARIFEIRLAHSSRRLAKLRKIRRWMTAGNVRTGSIVPTKQKIAKRERSKKVAVHRAEPKANIEFARNDKVPTSPAVIRPSLLDILKEGADKRKLN